MAGLTDAGEKAAILTAASPKRPRNAVPDPNDASQKDDSLRVTSLAAGCVACRLRSLQAAKPEGCHFESPKAASLKAMRPGGRRFVG